MNAFFIGAGFWWRGWAHLVSRPRLLILALVPGLISIVLTVIFIGLVFVQLPSWVQAMTQWLVGSESSWWSDVLYYSVVLFGGLLVTLGFIYLSYLLHRVIASPFYGLLAERILKHQGHAIQSTWLHILRMIWVSIGQTLIFAILGVLLFFSSLVPALNVLAFAVTLLLLAFDLCSFAFESFGWSLRERLVFLNQHRLLWAGMALGVGLTLFVPGLTLLIIPGAVVGATLLVGERVAR